MSTLVKSINNITVKDIPLHYRNEFKATVEYSTPIGDDSRDIIFVLERDPLGNRDISIKFVTSPNYPVFDLLQKLRSYILELDNEAKLPLA